MKKQELKKAIKPIIKECINEILIEEGLLANVVTEVAKGLQTSMIVESSHRPVATPPPTRPTAERSAIAQEQRKALMDAIGKDAYNGVNVFENTTPFTSREASVAPKPGNVDLGSPNDPGVDIGSLLGGASKMWKAMK